MKTSLFRQTAYAIGTFFLVAAVVGQTNSFPATGNVGIGTLSPTGKLDIQGSSATNAFTAPADQADLRVLSSNNRVWDGGIIEIGGSWGATGYIKTAAFYGNAGAMIFGTRQNPNDATMQPVMTLLGSYVGIGTTSPAGLLDVANTFYTVAQGTVAIRPQNSTVEGGELSLQGAAGNPTWSVDNYSTKLRLLTSTTATDNSSQVQIFSSPPGVAGLYVQGNVGIGIQNPAQPLHVVGSIRSDSGFPFITGTTGFAYWPAETSHVAYYKKAGPYRYYWRQSPTGYPSDADVELMNLADSGNLYVRGNVGIGTTNPTNKLEVNGTIRAKEVIVETTGWSDYVFAPDYRLAPLSEVEAHIAAKGTLPGIPSAAEVATQGVSVGDMQAKLLAKIEELTLRQIAQEKRLDAQSTQLSAQSTRITQLEAENAALKRSQP